jgi:hypothetical protein
MKPTRIISAMLAAFIAVGAAAQVQAQEKGKEKPKDGEKAEKKKSDAYPFNGKIASVDKTEGEGAGDPDHPGHAHHETGQAGHPR